MAEKIAKCSARRSVAEEVSGVHNGERILVVREQLAEILLLGRHL